MKQSNREFAELLHNLSLTCNMHGEEFRDFIRQHLGTEYIGDCSGEKNGKFMSFESADGIM